MKHCTLDELYQKFVTYNRAKNLAPETAAYYNRSYLFLRDFMQRHRMRYFSKLTQDDWVRFVGYLNNGTRKPVSVNTYLRGARALVRFCQKHWRSLPEVECPLLSYQAEVREAYSEKQVALLTVRPNTDEFVQVRCWAVTCMLLFSALREKSLLNIRVSDIDMSAMELRVRHLKNKKVIVFPLSTTIVAVVTSYLGVRNRHLAEHGLADSGYLFVSATGGTKLSRFTLFDAQQAYNRSRGVNKSGLHIYRNTFAKFMLRKRCDVFTLQRWLCHTDIQTTKCYVEMFSDDLRATLYDFNPLENFAENIRKSIDSDEIM
jgi:integrase/recombinase XerD